MGNTLLHFHYGKTDFEKDMQGLIYLKEYLNKFNKNIKLNEIRAEFYESWMEGIKDRKTTYKEYPIEEFINNFLQKYKIRLNLEECIEAINLFYTEYRENVYFEDTTQEVLKKLKDLGYKIGVISNTCYYDEVMIECFKKAKLYDLIDNFTFSYSIRTGKPDKQIFIEALKKMNVKPQEAIMVGDSLESDIKPALDLGMKTVFLNKNNYYINYNNEAYDEIASLSDLLKILL